MPASYYDKIVISDASSLIGLTNVGRLDIMQKLCKTILITPEVALEFGEALPDWISIIPVKNNERTNIITEFLDIGESSAIALASETENSLLIIDEKRGRRYAISIGLEITGTVGLLITAYKNGILDDIEGVFKSLRDIGFRIPKDIDI